MRASIRHRPWTVDVLSSLVLMGYGVFVTADRKGLDIAAYNFLDNVDVRPIGFGLVILGLAQLVVALLDFRSGRVVCAFFAFWHWSAFAYGLHTSDPHTYSVVAYGGYALANLLIILRV